MEILKLIAQSLVTFVSVYLGYCFSLRQADVSRRREYMLKELDAFRQKVSNSLQKISELPKSVSEDDALHSIESECKKRNKDIILGIIDWIQEKQDLLNRLMICNGITGDAQRNFTQAGKEVVECLGGDDFKKSNWWLPPDENKFKSAQNYLFHSLDDLMVATLNQKTGLFESIRNYF